MNVVAIPKKLTSLPKKDLVVIARQEYKALLALKKVKRGKEGKTLTLAALRELRDPKKRGKLPRYASAEEMMRKVIGVSK